MRLNVVEGLTTYLVLDSTRHERHTHTSSCEKYSKLQYIVFLLLLYRGRVEKKISIVLFYVDPYHKRVRRKVPCACPIIISSCRTDTLSSRGVCNHYFLLIAATQCINQKSTFSTLRSIHLR